MTESQRKLLDRSRDFLRAANRDLGAEDWSMAVSRAYYAVFHAATAALDSRGVDARSHEGTLRLFSHEFVSDGPLDRESGRTYTRLMQAREEADYASEPSITSDDGKEYVRSAETLVEEISSLVS